MECVLHKCINQAKYRCKCEKNILICKQHVGKHIDDKKTHTLTKLYVKVNEETRSGLIEKALEKIEGLKAERSVIIDKYCELMKRIEEEVRESDEEINR